MFGKHRNATDEGSITLSPNSGLYSNEGIKIGDIFVGYFGVTGFPEYYEVVALNGQQSVTLVGLRKRMEYVDIFDPPYNQNYTYKEWPISGTHTTEPFRVRVRRHSRYGPCFNLGGHLCELFDGKPRVVYSYMD
ncbi:MAG: hypothetical protein E7Z63_00960 [Thermoplasmata archaeon]|nr:hypothetical protein [Thermoplasmata archaeon]